MPVTDRELSWITVGTLLAVTLDGYRERGAAIEQAGGGWKVQILAWDGERYGHGGIYKVGRAGPRRIEHLLGPPYAQHGGCTLPSL